jgi:hypothetical protein
MTLLRIMFLILFGICCRFQDTLYLSLSHCLSSDLVKSARHTGPPPTSKLWWRGPIRTRVVRPPSRYLIDKSANFPYKYYHWPTRALNEAFMSIRLFAVGLGSVIATGWRVRKSNLGGGRYFPHLSRLFLEPTQLPIQWVLNPFPEGKRPGRGVKHLPPSSAEVKERVDLYICIPSGTSWPVLGRTFTLRVFATGFFCLLRNLFVSPWYKMKWYTFGWKGGGVNIRCSAGRSKSI